MLKRGFVLGKFMPMHKGHEAMIEYGLANCDELTVLVCSLPDEPIDGKLRYNWVKNRFPQARVLHCDKSNLPQYPHEHPYFWQIWMNVVHKYHPEKVDVIFGSEDYVETMAGLLGCEAMVFDKAREIVPVSGTKVRENPLKYWDYIGKDVREYFKKRVLIVGVESTGKSTLTEKLANHYGESTFMSEYAREYIDKELGGNMNKLTYEDFDYFAEDHFFLEKYDCLPYIKKVLFTDTDAITTLIFSREYFGKVSETILNLANMETGRYDLVLLCHPDVPWVDDGQRNLSHKRWELHEQFKKELALRDMEWVDIKGNWDERFAIAVQAVDKLMNEGEDSDV